MIITKGAGKKAYCAGGDLKLLYISMHEPHRVKNLHEVIKSFNYHYLETIY